MQRLRKTAIRRWQYYLFYATVLVAMLYPQLIQAQIGSKVITFQAKDEALSSAITRLSKTSGINISYPISEVKSYKKINLPAASRTVLETLKALLKGTELDCKQVSEMLVVFRKPKVQAELTTKNLISITGKVVDETGQPLPAITILLQGTSRGTTTNGSGSFELDYVPEDAPITAQGIGFHAQTFYATPVMVLRLSRSVSDLDEVQVIAYGTTTRRLNTGSVSTVNAKDIANQPITNPIAALEGRVPGLIVSQTSGVPGSALKIQIRGQSSLDLTRSQNDPLIVVDGVPFEAGNQSRNQFANASMLSGQGGISPLTLIPPSEIESIDVLKDADATAIYGSRGANGVILISTKKGKAGITNYSLNVNYGWSHAGRTLKFLNTEQYVTMRREAFANDGFKPSANPNDPGYAPDIMIFDTTRYTDFTKLLIGNTAQTFNAGLSVSGGTENTQFLIGGNYHKETTVYPGKFYDAIASLNTSINHRSKSGRFFISLSSQYSNDNNNLPVLDATGSTFGIIPNLRLYDSAGNIASEDKGISLNNGALNNPLYNLETIYSIRSDNWNTNLQFGYSILSNLTLRASTGYSIMNSDEYRASPTRSINPNNPDPLPSAGFGNSGLRSWIAEPQLEYASKGALGRINVLLGSTFQDKTAQSLQVTGRGYTSDLLLGSISGAATVTSSSAASQYRYSAFFGRINYNVQDKYILNLTGRRDGSSRFAPENRWANFGAAGFAWVFSSESFIEKSIPFLSYGKIRTSYGITGNDQIGDYKYLDLWRSSSMPYDGTSTLVPAGLYNRNYQWEINKKFEAAIDMGFLKDRILVSVAYFRNKSDNQLIGYSLPIQTGFFTITRNFPGLVQNKGIEMTATTRNISAKNFSWTSSFNISFPKNKLLKFPGLAQSSYADSYVIGQSLSVIRGYRYLGLDTQTGIYKFDDVNKDGSYTIADYLNFGNRDPKFYGGLQNNLNYKGWELTFLFSFRKQTGNNYLAQLTRPPGQMGNQPVLVLDRWQHPGDDAIGQQFTAGYTNIPVLQAGGLYVRSDAAYTDASFIKLRNIALYYTLPAFIMECLHLKTGRLYAQGQNLLTVTGYKGGDPEIQNIYIMPPLKTWVMGINLNF